MSDFLLDCRETERKNLSRAIDLFKYYDDIIVKVFDFEKVTIIISRADDWRIWGPYKSSAEGIFVALSGRIALERTEWGQAQNIEGEGGLACKAIYNMYRGGEIKSLENLNGNYVIILYDAGIQKIYLIVDRCGMVPCFTGEADGKEIVISSHPDVLAAMLDMSRDWNLTSMAEFLFTGRVSFPYTYYQKISALNYGSIHEIDLRKIPPIFGLERKYFNFDFRIDNKRTEWDLAEELASAFRKAMNRRVLPMFGQTAVSLSGGLDSRALLSSIEDRDSVWTFCFFDEENLEFFMARQIAEGLRVRFIPLRREFEHYGSQAEMGVKISGGMGDFGNNHYLSFRDAFKNIGIENLIAGFYCDYLFKSLVLNKRVNKLLRKEKFKSFEYDNYMPFIWFETKYATQVKERQDIQFPDELKKDESDLGRLTIERKRLFPLCYEPDHQETIVPERVMGWFLPTVDNDIIDTYLKIPPRYKLNTSMYSKMVEIVCGKSISKITNINTGARVNASWPELVYSGYMKALKKRFTTKKPSIATDESWPNWRYYLNNSKIIESLWLRKNDVAREIFIKVTGIDPYDKEIQDYKGKELKLFLRLLTLKIWLDQRTGVSSV